MKQEIKGKIKLINKLKKALVEFRKKLKSLVEENRLRSEYLNWIKIGIKGRGYYNEDTKKWMHPKEIPFEIWLVRYRKPSITDESLSKRWAKTYLSSNEEIRKSDINDDFKEFLFSFTPGYHSYDSPMDVAIEQSEECKFSKLIVNEMEKIEKDKMRIEEKYQPIRYKDLKDNYSEFIKNTAVMTGISRQENLDTLLNQVNQAFKKYNFLRLGSVIDLCEIRNVLGEGYDGSTDWLIKFDDEADINFAEKSKKFSWVKRTEDYIKDLDEYLDKRDKFIHPIGWYNS